MERSKGGGKIWHDVSREDRLEVVRTLVGYEKAFVSANFPMYGSLYYAKDLPTPSQSQRLDSINSTDKGEDFAIGPTTTRAFFDQGRDLVEANQGPCKFHYLYRHVPLKLIRGQGLHSEISSIRALLESWLALISFRHILPSKDYSAAPTNSI